jgi:hypothetical protein
MVNYGAEVWWAVLISVTVTVAVDTACPSSRFKTIGFQKDEIIDAKHPNRACSSVCTSLSNVSTSCFTRRAPGREDKILHLSSGNTAATMGNQRAPNAL